MGKAINISIKIEPSKELEKNSDLAPVVKDSDEPGVDKGEELMQADGLEKLMDKTPKGGFHDGAREKMKQRLMGLKKG